MILSRGLTTGQITFILRVTIQILSYGGAFLIGLIILSSAPRVASVHTHDVLNRAVGKSTVTFASIKWMFRYKRGKSGDPVVPLRVLISVGLLILYSAFVSLTDIGYIGLYSCDTGGGHYLDYPASVRTTDEASAMVASSLVNGTDPSSIKAHMCNYVEVIHFGPNITERNCTLWSNSTYADRTFWSHLNTTDSDVLMARRLRHLDQPRSAFVDLNSFYLGPGTKRVSTTVITNGLVVNPHETGVQMVIGVPQLVPQQRATIDKTLAVEVDFGCMELGIYSQHDPDAFPSPGIDVFATNGTWRKYSGPTYLQPALSKAADDIRSYWLPFFNLSTLTSDGLMVSYNESDNDIFSTAAAIQNVFLPNSNAGIWTWNDTSGDPDLDIARNCTVSLRQLLNLTVLDADDVLDAQTCTTLALAGSVESDGNLLEGLSRMVCATASQVNMVSAIVEVDSDGVITLNVTRLPSNLNYIRASYWDAIGPNITEFMPIERYTLSDDATGATQHFITPYDSWDGVRPSGPGSGGSVLSRVGNSVFDVSGVLASEFSALLLLDDGYNAINFTPDAVTRWAGQVGASVLFASTAYNGWAALSSSSIDVQSTGGQLATCYKPRYAFAFLPLAIAFLIVLLWATALLCTSSLSESGKVEELYGGLNPFLSAVRGQLGPGVAPPTNETWLIWKAHRGREDKELPLLEVFDDWETNPKKTITQTALKYVKESEGEVKRNSGVV